VTHGSTGGRCRDLLRAVQRAQDDPEKLKVFSNLALSALKDVPETKQTKELSGKIQKGLKK